MSYRELLSGERLLETLRHSPACSQNYLDAIPEVRVRGGGAVIGEQAALDGVQVRLVHNEQVLECGIHEF